jgi:hypothetical protein
MKVFEQLCCNYNLALKFFWQKSIGTKFVYTLLVKLTREEKQLFSLNAATV